MEFIPDLISSERAMSPKPSSSGAAREIPATPLKPRTFAKRRAPEVDDVKLSLAKKFKEQEVNKHSRHAFTHEGANVYKIGFEKCVYARFQDGVSAIVIGEWKKQSDDTYRRTLEKSITVKKPGFMRLCALIMSGKGDLDKISQCSSGTDGKLTPLYALENGLYFGWGRYNRVNTATVRRYTLGNNGDLIPTKAGVTFGLKTYDGLKELVVDMTLLKELLTVDEANHVTKTLKSALAYDKLKEEVAEEFTELIHQMRGRNAKMVCGSASDDEWAAAEKAILESRYVEAVLLEADQVDVGQVIGLDVKGYLELNALEFRAMFAKLI
ncbi:uncharacterized protein LOC129588869 [Paramacrobiotus metropolitanus]|uniref:uncharacterized protein LOC129588869 n=1 Tax=Paramacrobiotus metropolitanus TaxID=2943436 RepID=UPI00244595FB|nr:uncharacterized protein LOC129588869 [Paramacrobiotus metropolitanus]